MKMHKQVATTGPKSKRTKISSLVSTASFNDAPFTIENVTSASSE